MTGLKIRKRLLARYHRNSIVAAMAKQFGKTHAAWMNENRSIPLNGEMWIARHLACEASFGLSPVLFDVGANDGEWSMIPAAANAKAQIHAFEPASDTFAELQKVTALAPNIICNCFGLSDRSGDALMFSNRGSKTRSIYPHPKGRAGDTTRITMMCGDEYMASRGIERINFLKIDVEGAEQKVLAGFSSALSHKAIDVIQFEYGVFNIASRAFVKDFYEQLAGFRLGLLFPTFVKFSDYHQNLENFRPANFIAVREDLETVRAALAG